MNEDEIKEAKKLLTKMTNKVVNSKSHKVYALSDEISKVYYSQKNKSENAIGDENLKNAFWGLRNDIKSILNYKNLAEGIEAKYPEFAKRIMEFYHAKINGALEAAAFKEEIENALNELNGGNSAQRAFKALIKLEKDTESQKKLSSFLSTLKNWEAPRIENGVIFINGKAVEKNTLVGVLIGTGQKIHTMPASVCVDEKTGDEFIGLGNYTQWRQSSLVIIDAADAIPQEVLAYRKELFFDEGEKIVVDNEVEQMSDSEREVALRSLSGDKNREISVF